MAPRGVIDQRAVRRVGEGRRVEIGRQRLVAYGSSFTWFTRWLGMPLTRDPTWS